MKKVISKISKIITAFVVTAMLVFVDTESIGAAAKTIKVGKVSMLPAYVAGTKYNIKPLVGGGYGYCLNIHKGNASNSTQYLEKEMNAGIAYILENGYPKKHFTGSKKKDFYITQGAIWWYLDDTTGTSYLSKAFKTNGSDKYGLRKYMKTLVSGAKKAKSAGYSKPSLNAKVSTTKATLSSDGKYYVSKSIDANAKNIDGKYKVSVTSAPSGTIITDTNGNKQSSFKASEKFLIKIPASKIAEGKTAKAKVKITASSTINKAYKYAPKNNSIQPMTVLQPYTKNVSDTISVSATKPKTPKKTPPAPTPTPTPEPAKVSILKLDKDTNAAVEGAVLVIKDVSGNEVERFTSTNEAYEIENIANGTYTVEEVEAPAGYELSTEKQTFTISDSVRTVEVKYYNKAQTSVVSIFKLDKNTNNPVTGAVLVIKDANGNEIKKITSSANGNSITGLSNGTYTVEEVEAPAGYELSTEKQTFTLDDNTKTVEVKFYNIPKDRMVTISKVDSTTGNPVSGAVIVVTNENGEEVARFTSTNEAYVIKNIPDGTYTVEEEEAPEGYFLNEETQTFTIDSEHLSYQVTIKDVPKTCENGGKDDDECYVEVPDTGSSSLPFYLIGIAIVSVGGLYVYKNNKKAYK